MNRAPKPSNIGKTNLEYADAWGTYQGDVPHCDRIGICRGLDATFEDPVLCPPANIVRRLASPAPWTMGGTVSVLPRHELHISAYYKDVPPLPLPRFLADNGKIP